MKKLQPIICLPTDKASNLAMVNCTKEFIILHDKPSLPKTPITYQFLYILSDEPIKEGDWYISKGSPSILHWSLEMCDDKSHTDKWKDKNCFFKIIATSNPELWDKIEVDSKGIERGWIGIPKFPLSLIEHYAKYQPKEIMVEYEHITTWGENNDGAGESLYYAYEKDGKTPKTQLKLTPSGEICWSPIEEKKKFVWEPVEVNGEDPRAEVDVEKLAEEEYPFIKPDPDDINKLRATLRNGFVDGYTACQNDIRAYQASQQKAEVKEESWEEIFKKSPFERIDVQVRWLKENYHSPKKK
jgi:hypothetical protein